VCSSNPLDMLGNNEMAVRWKLVSVNRDGLRGTNKGVTVISLRRGRAATVTDVLSDTGEQWRRSWGES